MKVKVNEDACIGCGACCAIADSIFEIGDNGLSEVKKEEMPYLTHTGISSTVFSVLWKVYNNSQVVCFSSNFSSNDPRLI